MTDSVLLALITSVPPTIAALAALWVGIHNGGKADETGKKADALIVKTAEIHTATDGNLSSLTKTLAVAQEKIDGLEKTIAMNAENKKISDAIQIKQASS